MRNLISYLDPGSECEEGLGRLKVDKIDYYNDKNAISIRLSGNPEEVSREKIDDVMRMMEQKSGSRVTYYFAGESKKVSAEASERDGIPVAGEPAHPGLDAELAALLAEQEREKKERAKSRKDKKEAPARNSWVAKANEQKEIAGVNGQKKKFTARKNADAIIGRVISGAKKINISDIDDYSQNVNIEGRIMYLEDQKKNNDILKLTKNGNSVIAKFYIIDATGGVNAVMFLKPEEADIYEKRFMDGGYAGFQVSFSYDRNEPGVRVSGIYEAEPPAPRRDECEYKRVELHVHSKMSEKDAVSNPADIMKLAASFGHRACAITDHGVVQGFPQAYEAMKDINRKKEDGDEKFKAILGCEGYLADDGPTIFYNLPFVSQSETVGKTGRVRSVGEFVTIAIDTTGDDECSDKITRIAASKYRLKGYRDIRPVEEGESDAQAQEFASHDIDRSLWTPEEIPEQLRDENLPGIVSYEEKGADHKLNVEAQIETPYSDDGTEIVLSAALRRI